MINIIHGHCPLIHGSSVFFVYILDEPRWQKPQSRHVSNDSDHVLYPYATSPPVYGLKGKRPVSRRVPATIFCRVPARWGLQQTHPGLRAATRHGVRDPHIWSGFYQDRVSLVRDSIYVSWLNALMTPESYGESKYIYENWFELNTVSAEKSLHMKLSSGSNSAATQLQLSFNSSQQGVPYTILIWAVVCKKVPNVLSHTKRGMDG